ncbi:hypothetical protein [Granulicella rosea]|uniref:hypothetical protein n=1 Tax=Granulicella rosea TaxID=474952 RepID=UPI000B7843B8|nr:hypothetical protein [Granulicella rosea]
MRKLIIFAGTAALFSALIDVIHGQHNGDVHRTYIHVAELVLFLLFLTALALQGRRQAMSRFDLGGWAASLCISLASIVLGFALFGLSGGSAHGDGGAISVAFGIFGILGIAGVPISLVGWLIARFNR